MDSTFSPFSRAKYFSIYEILINDKKIHGWHPSYTRSYTIRIASLASSCTVYHVQADGGGVWIEFHYSISFSFFFFFCDWFALTRVSFDLFDFNGKTFCTQSSSSMPIAMPHHLMPYMQRMHACNNVISVVFGRIFDVFSILQQLLSLLCDLFEPRYPFVRHEICLLLNKIRKIAMSIVHWPHAPKIHNPKSKANTKLLWTAAFAMSFTSFCSNTYIK